MLTKHAASDDPSDAEISRRSAGEALPDPGALVDIHSVRHRLLAFVGRRALLTDLRTHHVWLIADASGILQLPTKARLLDMLRSGQAQLIESIGPTFTPTEKLQFEIDLLDAHGVRQGDKAIWRFLAQHWTPDLVARFGPHDDPWRIRRWRADLRNAEQRPSS